MNKGALLEILTEKKSLQASAYKQFIAEKNPEEIENFYSLKKLISVLGSVSFEEDVKNRFDEKLFDRELSKREELTVSVETILSVVCSYFSVDQKTLMTSQWGVSNLPRDITMFLLKNYRIDTLDEIASVLGAENYSTLSNGINRIKKKISRDERLAEDLKGRREAECEDLRLEVKAEAQKHGVAYPPAVTSNHSKGNAFDLAISGLSNNQIDSAAQSCGLYRFAPIKDKNHFSPSP